MTRMRGTAGLVETAWKQGPAANARRGENRKSCKAGENRRVRAPCTLSMTVAVAPVAVAATAVAATVTVSSAVVRPA